MQMQRARKQVQFESISFMTNAVSKDVNKQSCRLLEVEEDDRGSGPKENFPKEFRNRNRPENFWRKIPIN